MAHPGECVGPAARVAREEQLRLQRVRRIGEAARLAQPREEHVRLARLVEQQQRVRQPAQQRAVALALHPAQEEAGVLA